uniref:R13L1/DRL21-like LRR repeat region domain-containing protein n=1 Tax=Quercus lobata TaxID=97700 RepID=A0A7N2MVM9_QUELO
MGTRLSPIWMMSLTTLKKLTLSACLKLECLPPLWKLPFLESFLIASTKNVRKVGDEFLGIELEPKNKSKNKKDDYDVVFPNLKLLKFVDLDNWEEWKEIGAAREEVENALSLLLDLFSLGSDPYHHPFRILQVFDMSFRFGTAERAKQAIHQLMLNQKALRMVSVWSKLTGHYNGSSVLYFYLNKP